MKRIFMLQTGEQQPSHVYYSYNTESKKMSTYYEGSTDVFEGNTTVTLEEILLAVEYGCSKEIEQ